MITRYDFVNSVCCQEVRITRGGAIGACSACGPTTGRISGADGRGRAKQAHGPKIRQDVAALLAGLRRDAPPLAQ